LEKRKLGAFRNYVRFHLSPSSMSIIRGALQIGKPMGFERA
jgi:hypothetical protein